jgi:hypothetical protein
MTIFTTSTSLALLEVRRPYVVASTAQILPEATTQMVTPGMNVYPAVSVRIE